MTRRRRSGSGAPRTAQSASITTNLPAANIVAFSEPLVHHPTVHPFDELCELIRQRGWGRGRVGVDFDAHYYTARAHQHLTTGLPEATVADNRELVNWARLVKSPAELAYMREAGALTTRVMNQALANLAPGVRQKDIIADVYHAQVRAVEGMYGDYTSICPLIQVAEATSTPHLTWTDAPLPGEGLVVMELGAARRHYHAPLTRTAHLGKAPPQIRKLAAVIVEGGDRALEAARPGATCAEVEAVWQKVLNRNGYRKESRVGYSIGVGFPPDWGERTASLRPGDTTVLEAGMCFHFQSGMWLDDFGAAISESFVVTESGGRAAVRGRSRSCSSRAEPRCRTRFPGWAVIASLRPFKGTAASMRLGPDRGSPLYTGWPEHTTLSVFAVDAGKGAAGLRVCSGGLGDRDLSRE